MKKFNSKNYPWSLSGLISCIRENSLDSNILFYTETAAIVHVKSYNDSIILGAESDWCISQHIESWHKYVSDGNMVQLFFYNFGKKVSEDDSLVGVTFDVDEKTKKVKVVCGFTRPNYPIRELFNGKYKTDEDTLIKGVIDVYFDGITENIKESICGLKPKEKKVETVKKAKTSYYNWAIEPPIDIYPHYVDTYDDWDDIGW